MREVFRRAARTFLQSWSGIFLGLWAISGVGAEGNLAGLADLSTVARIGFAAGIGSIPALVALLQNAGEETGVIPPVLKGKQSRARS